MTQEILVEFVKTHPEAKLPTYAHPLDVGADLYCVEDFDLWEGETIAVSAGIKLAYCDPDYEIQVRPKSGLALKEGIVVVNSPGTIDPGYRSDIKVILHKNSRKDAYASLLTRFKAGDKIAQLVINRRYEATFKFTDTVTESVRGEGGFGSTGR